MNLTGVTLGATRHVAIFQGRHKFIYGINGATRGFRWDGAASTVQPIGLLPPPSTLTINGTAATTNNIVAINVAAGGFGYHAPPLVTVQGGGGTGAKAAAQIVNGVVTRVRLVAGGSGYTCPPEIVMSGGQGTGAVISVGVDGRIREIVVANAGTGYTGSVTVAFGGISGAVGRVDVSGQKILGVVVEKAGTGATTTASATIYGSGTSAAVECIMQYKVISVTATNAGTQYSGRVPVIFTTNVAGVGGGAAAYFTANSTNGSLQNPVMQSQGVYDYPPAVDVAVTAARAVAVLRKPQQGSYRCCFRYLDDTSADDGGPCPSVISDLVTVDSATGNQSFNWTWETTGADARAQYVELWRTSANQTLVLYRVAKLPRTAGVLPTTYQDTLTEEQLLDPTRADFALMPITLPSGQLNARRFVPPPNNMEDACMFQDRAWYAVNTDGTMPNTLLFSEVDEPESVPDVNEILLQENTGAHDRISAIIPFGSILAIAQESHLYKLQYVSQPIIDASVLLVGHRGVLNKRCWSTLEGTLFCVDSFGMYAFDGQSIEPVSAAVDDYWRTSRIDFSKAKDFLVQSDPVARVIRFHYSTASDTGLPSRALCYSVVTKSWWEEQYSQKVAASEVLRIAGKQTLVAGLQSGSIVKLNSGNTDIATGGGTTGVPFQMRTPPLLLVDEPDRKIGVLYTPTSATQSLTLKLHFNNSSTARSNAIHSDIGEGAVASPGGVVIDMRSARSALGTATGLASARYSGRANDRSAGADRHMAVDFSGTQSLAPVVIHSVTVSGVSA
jgi:hypothetical protein